MKRLLYILFVMNIVLHAGLHARMDILHFLEEIRDDAAVNRQGFFHDAQFTSYTSLDQILSSNMQDNLFIYFLDRMHLLIATQPKATSFMVQLVNKVCNIQLNDEEEDFLKRKWLSFVKEDLVYNRCPNVFEWNILVKKQHEFAERLAHQNVVSYWQADFFAFVCTHKVIVTYINYKDLMNSINQHFMIASHDWPSFIPAVIELAFDAAMQNKTLFPLCCL